MNFKKKKYLVYFNKRFNYRIICFPSFLSLNRKFHQVKCHFYFILRLLTTMHCYSATGNIYLIKKKKLKLFSSIPIGNITSSLPNKQILSKTFEFSSWNSGWNFILPNEEHFAKYFNIKFQRPGSSLFVQNSNRHFFLRATVKQVCQRNNI